MATARKRRRSSPPPLPQFSGAPNSDRGAVGQAMLVRPCVLVPVATGSLSIGRERTECLAYQDDHLIDRMNRAGQLSNRQHEAAHKFLEMFVAAGHATSRTSRYGEALGRSESEGGDVDQPTDRDIYRRFVRRYADHTVGLLESVMLEQHPGVRWLASVQAALDRLANDWRLGDDAPGASRSRA